jgi:FkbM family methyltransferase
MWGAGQKGWSSWKPLSRRLDRLKHHSPIVNRIIKSIIKNQVIPVVASRPMQPLYRFMNRCTLAAMNIGIGSDVGSSGEHHVQRHVARLLKGRSRPVVFDVGANVGLWALAANEAFGGEFVLHCCEPSAETGKKLAQTLQEGGCPATIHALGAGDAPATLILYRPEQSSVASLYHRPVHEQLSGATVEEQVVIRRLDAVCAELGIRTIDFLKLDIEGHELAALKGCGEMLTDGSISVVQFEFGGCNVDSRTYFRDFWNLLSERYRLFRVLPHGLSEIPRYEEWLEQFTTTNFVAVSRRLPAS